MSPAPINPELRALVIDVMVEAILADILEQLEAERRHQEDPAA